MTNKNILLIRKQLDRLDNSFLNLVKKRTKLVDKVLSNKRYKKDIIDIKRIKVIINNIKRKSKQKNIDPKITEQIWKAMIKAYIQYEYRNFKK